jgi:hypothetical protein
VAAGGGQPVTTDASGVATMTVAPGEVTLVATKDRYQPAKGRIEAAAGGTHVVRLVLEPPITNDGTIVTSTRTNRRADDQAVPVAMLVRGRIDARTPTTPGDITTLFNEMSGVRTQSTSSVLGTNILRIQGLPAGTRGCSPTVCISIAIGPAGTRCCASRRWKLATWSCSRAPRVRFTDRTARPVR